MPTDLLNTILVGIAHLLLSIWSADYKWFDCGCSIFIAGRKCIDYEKHSIIAFFRCACGKMEYFRENMIIQMFIIAFNFHWYWPWYWFITAWYWPKIHLFSYRIDISSETTWFWIYVYVPFRLNSFFSIAFFYHFSMHNSE